jgi:hypothetical protein
MQRHKLLVRSLLTGITLLNLAQIPKVLAETTWVQSGPHGAIQIVDSDRLPIGATKLPHSSGLGSPKLVMRGSHGAFQLTNNEKMTGQKMTESQPSALQRTGMTPQYRSQQNRTKSQSANRLNAEELLKITDPLI